MFKRKSFLKRLIRFLPALFWMGLIFYLSSIPNLKTDLETIYDMILRKGAHMFEYFVLIILLWYAFKPVRLWILTKLNIVFILAFLYAVSDEWHQTFIMSRSGNIWDVGIDSFGIILGILAIRFFPRLGK